MPRIIVVVLGLLATVLGLPADQADPTTWVAPVVFGGVVWGTVAYLRAHVLKELDGINVTITAAIVGVGLAIALGVAQVLPGAVLEWVIFGLQGTFIATIGDQMRKAGQGNQLRPAE